MNFGTESFDENGRTRVGGGHLGFKVADEREVLRYVDGQETGVSVYKQLIDDPLAVIVLPVDNEGSNPVGSA